MKYNFEDKVSLVTGAGSGIGRATAIAFALSGAKTVVSDIDVSKGKETVEIIKKSNGEAIFVQADVSVSDEVAKMVELTVNTYGKLDYACNNAGISIPARLTADHTENEWDQVIDTNLKSVWLCMKYEIPEMLKQSTSAIVNTASVAGLIGTSLFAAYTASKHGVIGLTKTCALDYAKTGLRINAVCPGFTKTPILDSSPDTVAILEKSIPMGRMATPEEIANTVLWLCSDHASYVNGHSMLVDGGYCIP